MILLAGFAALAWSRTARDVAGPIGTWPLAVTAILLLAAFVTLRVADEHKDAAIDRVSRPELPVPRGLVTLAELRAVAAPLVVIAVALSASVSWLLLLPLGATALWLALMTREFFAPEWLRAHPLSYLLSHMVIMPLLLLTASAVDWLPGGGGAPHGLPWFLAAAYGTGLVLEIGRKIRAPADERPGVDTYTSAWGLRRATAAWGASLTLSAATIAVLAERAEATLSARVTIVAAILIAVPVARLALAPRVPRSAKGVEVASALWVFVAYGCLALPWIERQLR